VPRQLWHALRAPALLPASEALTTPNATKPCEKPVENTCKPRGEPPGSRSRRRRLNTHQPPQSPRRQSHHPRHQQHARQHPRLQRRRRRTTPHMQLTRRRVRHPPRLRPAEHKHQRHRDQQHDTRPEPALRHHRPLITSPAPRRARRLRPRPAHAACRLRTPPPHQLTTARRGNPRRAPCGRP
jgi:hypothetical protein